MSSKSRTVALVPLRGGSKGIPGKNIRRLAGKPMALWCIEAAAACQEIDEVYVTTDDSRIRETILSAAVDKVRVIGRSAESASDTAATEDVMLEFAQQHPFDTVVLVQATSPLTTNDDLAGALKLYASSGATSLLSVVEQRRFIWKQVDGIATPENYTPYRRPRRQEMQPYLVENGAFYVTSRAALLASRCRLSGKIVPYRMREHTYYELDDIDDLIVIEELLQKRQNALSRQSRARNPIRLLLTDVDGVLTDSGMYYTERGDEAKKFNTRDGKAFELLRQSGISVGIVTSENTKIVSARAAKLKVDVVKQGVADKLAIVKDLAAERGLRMEEIAFIGDDVNDLATLQAVGLSACPADAVNEVRKNVAHVCTAVGGGGCVREFAELILAGDKNGV